MDGTIASAVMLPEVPEADVSRAPAPSPAAQKRRQSSLSEADSKRQRLSSIDAPKKAPARRERGREQRLFGAVIGSLSRNSATAAQRNRTDTEKRQRAQRELAEQKNGQQKLELDAQRKAQRQREQERFERDAMRLRHANLLNMAHFLRTEAEPRLYYKPWELTADEEDRIQEQIAEAEDMIRRELEDYRRQHGPYEQRERHFSRSTGAERDAGANPPTGKEVTADACQQPAANGNTNDSGPSSKDPERRGDHAQDSTAEAVSGEHAAERGQEINTASHGGAEDTSNDMDDNAEEVVEAAEDTVIY